MMRYFLSFLLISCLVLCQMALADPRVDANTMLLLTFNEGNGKSSRDLSGNGNDGELKGAIWAEGKYGNGVEFKNDGDCVVMPSSPTLDLTEELSLEIWVKPSAVDIRVDIVSKHESGGYAIILDPGGIFRASFHIAGNYVASTAVNNLNANEWRYLAATFDGETLKVYIDAELEGEAPAKGTVTSTAVSLAIGGNSGPGGVVSSYYFKGVVDELRVSNVARTPEEIRKAMETEGSVEPSGKLSITWADVKTP